MEDNKGCRHFCFLYSWFPILISTGKSTPQYKWLKDELPKVDRSTTPWLIVLMHCPIYNSNSHHFMEGETMRAVFESWFVKYKADVVFSGHVHAYERSVSTIHFLIQGGFFPSKLCFVLSLVPECFHSTPIVSGCRSVYQTLHIILWMECVLLLMTSLHQSTLPLEMEEIMMDQL